MPSAPDFLRAKWGGDRDGTPGCGDGKAITFLEKRGYYLTSYWMWLKPTPNYEPTFDELDAIDFLTFEWNYGGIHNPRTR